MATLFSLWDGRLRPQPPSRSTDFPALAGTGYPTPLEIGSNRLPGGVPTGYQVDSFRTHGIYENDR
jgi:hypothetical protein